MTPARTGFGPASAAAAAEPTPELSGVFPMAERQLLLATPGIGHAAVCRIEGVGVHAIAELHALGVQAVVDRICRGVGNLAWRNRRRALLRALNAVNRAGAFVADQAAARDMAARPSRPGASQAR